MTFFKNNKKIFDMKIKEFKIQAIRKGTKLIATASISNIN